MHDGPEPWAEPPPTPRWHDPNTSPPADDGIAKPPPPPLNTHRPHAHQAWTVGTGSVQDIPVPGGRPASPPPAEPALPGPVVWHAAGAPSRSALRGTPPDAWKTDLRAARSSRRQRAVGLTVGLVALSFVIGALTIGQPRRPSGTAPGATAPGAASATKRPSPSPSPSTAIYLNAGPRPTPYPRPDPTLVPSVRPGATVVRIGVSLPMGGTWSTEGGPARDAVLAAIKNAGAPNGVTIEPVFLD